VCVCVCVCVCVGVCMYVCIHTYILRPNETTHAIYYVLAAVFASYFNVLFKFCFVRGSTQGWSIVTSFKVLFYFFKVIASCCYVLFKFCFVQGVTQGPPLVNPLNFFLFSMLITS